jgi:hypothetical protein
VRQGQDLLEEAYALACKIYSSSSQPIPEVVDAELSVMRALAARALPVDIKPDAHAPYYVSPYYVSPVRVLLIGDNGGEFFLFNT